LLWSGKEDVLYEKTDKEDNGMNEQKPKKVKCPSCGKEVPYEGNPFRPFCSRGCKGLDLIHWAEGSYRIHKSENEDEDGENGE